MFQYQQKPVSLWSQSGSWWIYPCKWKRWCYIQNSTWVKEIEITTETCLCGHLRPDKTLLWPRDSQSERSCHSSRSWRCQRPPAGGWHWWSDPPESPTKAKAMLTSGAWEFPTWQPTRWPGNLTHLHFAWSWFLLLLVPSDCNCCKVLDDTFRVHSLSCPGFSAVK